jgi:hypothetical protein
MRWRIIKAIEEIESIFKRMCVDDLERRLKSFARISSHRRRRCGVTRSRFILHIAIVKLGRAQVGKKMRRFSQRTIFHHPRAEMQHVRYQKAMTCAKSDTCAFVHRLLKAFKLKVHRHCGEK